ncbi:MAG: hypothetical protein AB9897_06050 [Anaerolineaceae bacterium]
MLKTGRTTETSTLPGWVSLLLIFLVFVLGVHFLVEDLSASTPKNLAFATYQNQSEDPHQEDIVQFTKLPSQIPSDPTVHVNPLPFTLKAQIFFPSFNPPNI